MNSETSLSIIFPCFNEEESVSSVLAEALTVLKNEVPVEILVIDDGSKDQTHKKLQDFAEHIRIIQHERNLGYGAAIKTGLFYSKHSTIAFMDFDGTCSPQESLEMLNLLQQTRSDMVMGIRLHPDSQMPKTRWLGNQLYRGLLRTLYPSSQKLPKDVCTGFRLLNKKAAETLFAGLPDDLSFSPALTAKALKLNYKITDHKISYRQRLGRSKISLVKDGLRFGKAIVYERFS